jgi:hypothetical protein
MATAVVGKEKLQGKRDKQDLNRLYKLFRRYETRAIQGVKDGHLFFNQEQIIQHAGKMAMWHLKTEAERQ